MNNEIFQQVFDKLTPILPVDWKKLILFAGYTNDSYTMKYYTSDAKGTYTDCFSQGGANKVELIKLFMSIDKILQVERTRLDAKNKWTVLTMIVEPDGSMKTEFDYADISEDAIAYEQSWKCKYIK